MSYIREVWKYWSLKDGFCSISQKFTGRPFCGGSTKNFKCLADIFFWEGFQNILLLSLLLFSFASYWPDLHDIQWNEVATSTARNFNNNWPLYLNFSNMVNFCPNNWFIKNQYVSNFYFEKGAAKKIQFFHIFKGPSFRNGWPYWYKRWRVLRDFCELSKKCGFATFPEI